MMSDIPRKRLQPKLRIRPVDDPVDAPVVPSAAPDEPVYTHEEHLERQGFWDMCSQLDWFYDRASGPAYYEGQRQMLEAARWGQAPHLKDLWVAWDAHIWQKQRRPERPR